MHIFLTGAVKVGKSTLIENALKQLQITPGGFMTVSNLYNQNNASGIFIRDAGKESINLFDQSHLVGRRYKDGFRQAFPEVFDTLGVEILDQAGPPLILMDELGFMERAAYLFQEKVLSLLDGDIPVLGVIKPQAEPFLDRVRQHAKVHIIPIDTDNRDRILIPLIILLKKQIR